ncbi:hypothetical protein [Streptomyces sp. NPDC060184]|uniref:hypothetical protein n=1 Tax=Streptomyces sp. NPDC060184 TaxID=3347064 RepID=UPI00364EA0F7
MTDREGAPQASGDQGCLRQVLMVPLVILYLVAGFFLYTALTIRPSGSWDDDARAGIVLSCLLTLLAGAATAGLLLLPPVRRIMGLGWAAPALLMAVGAIVRWATTG